MVDVPADAPAVCPVCEKPYESVTAHTDGVMVALNDNERYRRVCFDPREHDGEAGLYFYHHTHQQAEADGRNTSESAPSG